MKRLKRLLAISVTLTSFAGCDPYLKSTSVAVRDPAAVRYVDEATGKTIPYSTGHDDNASNEIKKDDVRVGNHYSELIVTGYESPGGTLVTKWNTDAKFGMTRWPIERTAVLENNGTITIPDHVALDSSHDAAAFPVCARFDTLGRSHAPFRHPVSNAVVGTPCDGPHDLIVVATTPWSNVETVHHISENDPGRNIMLAVVSSALAGIAGTVLLVEGDHGNHPAETVGGFAALGLGGVIDLAVLIPAIFSRDRDQVVYEAKR